MQLAYRGIKYHAVSVSISPVDSGLTATYRGLSYSIPQSNTIAILPTKTLKYRGIPIGESEVGYYQVSDPAMA